MTECSVVRTVLYLTYVLYVLYVLYLGIMIISPDEDAAAPLTVPAASWKNSDL